MAKKEVQPNDESQDDASQSKVKYDLTDLPGVGDATLKKLKEAGPTCPAG